MSEWSWHLLKNRFDLHEFCKHIIHAHSSFNSAQQCTANSRIEDRQSSFAAVSSLLLNRFESRMSPSARGRPLDPALQAFFPGKCLIHRPLSSESFYEQDSIAVHIALCGNKSDLSVLYKWRHITREPVFVTLYTTDFQFMHYVGALYGESGRKWSSPVAMYPVGGEGLRSSHQLLFT